MTLITTASRAYAQHTCGTAPHTPPAVTQSSVDCFFPNTPSSIIAEQEFFAYINLNVHLFVGDDCLGATQIAVNQQLEAFVFAENYVQQANKNLADNERPWGDDTWPNNPGPYVPFRYVLKGVYIHCKDNINFYQGENPANYQVNSSTEINVFISDICSPDNPNTPFH